MKNIILRITSATKVIKDIPLEQLLTLQAEIGASYALIDVATNEISSDLILKKQGDTLVIENDQEVIAQIENFYSEGQAATFEIGALTAAGTTTLITASDTAAEDSHIVWDASDNQDAPAALAGESEGFNDWGLLGAGLVGLAAVTTGAVIAATEKTEPDINNIVEGTIVGGPVVETNDLKVIAYQADGVTVLGEGTVGADGKFSINVGSYTGVVIAKVVNEGAGADYLDEATGVGKDLNAELFSMGVVSTANSTLTLNMNALTTVAYQKAIEQSGSEPLDETTVVTVNAAIAEAFGLTNLQETTITTINGETTFDNTDGLDAGETYGAVLAALSGADKNNGGDSQATIDELVSGITLAGDTATLNADAQETVIDGGDTAAVNAGGETSVIVDTLAPELTSNTVATALNENSGASQVVYTAVATDASQISYSLKTGVADQALFTIDSATGAVTLTADPDFETKPSYSFTVVATDAATNSSEQAVSLAVNNLDEVAPTITSATTATAIDENSGASQVVYTATSTDTADTATGSTSYSLKTNNSDDASSFSIDSSSGAVTLTADPDFETKASYNFTVVATDAVNNNSEQAVSLAINDVAPSTSVIMATIQNTADAVVQSNETGTAYLVKDSVTVTDVSSMTSAGDTNYNEVAISTVDTDTNLAATGLVDGSYKVYTVDAAGNLSGASTNSVTIDSTAPTASVTTATIKNTTNAVVQSSETGTAYLVKDSITVTDGASITGSGDTNYNEVSISTADMDTNLAATGLVDGSYKVYTVDAAGNLSGASTNSVTIDSTAPTASVTTATIKNTTNAVVQSSETGTAYLVKDSITVTDGTSITGSGDTNYNEVTISTADTDTNLAATGLVDGSYKVYTVDAAGNLSGASTNSVTIDSTAPTASVTTATIKNTTNAVVQSSETGTAYLVKDSVTVTDVASITGSGDTNYNEVAISTADTDTNLAATGLVDGSYNVYTVDAAGNLSSASINSVTIDTTAPTTTVTGASYDAATNVLTFTGTAMSTLLSGSETASTDIKGNLDWSKLQWDIDSDNTGNITFSEGDIASALAVDAATLEVTLTSAKAATLEGATGFDPLDTDDTVEVTTGFSGDTVGNTSATDAYDGPAYVNDSIVVFDLIGGTSSNHSSRVFDVNTQYVIYFVTSPDLVTMNIDENSGVGTFGVWTGGENLGSDDAVRFVGPAGNIVTHMGFLGNDVNGIFLGSTRILLDTLATNALSLKEGGELVRKYNFGQVQVTVMSGAFHSPGATPGATFGNVYSVAIPDGIMTSQGLA